MLNNLHYNKKTPFHTLYYQPGYGFAQMFQQFWTSLPIVRTFLQLQTFGESSKTLLKRHAQNFADFQRQVIEK